jgi:hypothetical protein
MEVGSRLLMALVVFISMIQSDDHAEADLEKQRHQVSRSAATEAFARLKLLQAKRL